MKRIVFAIVAVSMMVSLGYGQSKGFVLGFDSSMLFGKTTMSGSGIVKAIGLSPGIGIAYKKYFKPIEVEQFTGYWAIGTDALILPYGAIGGEYILNIPKDSDANLYFGVNVTSRTLALFIPIPAVALGVHF